ncbi:GspH/FimT family pseudopilin [Pseudomonas sp. LS1212]|uniref:GspH/FimT family pseudopilin n=1 Tax=Pseudomonas sp. LS1212 TaxID=2972478 RepID=UPI00215CF9FF|nr:GspH/FimT family pseudopilin [Pseudomonas sp. LS1212]UVJ43358.1 GspH/FimT family pseudopilin [Pseudomonas sp. LS1212]
MHPRCRAFSLIELLATVVLISTLAALIAPAFTGVIQRAKADTEMSDLMRVLKFAHLEAIDRGQSLRVMPSVAGGDWSSELKVVTIADPDTPLRVVPAMASDAVVNAPGVTAIDFNNLGGLAAPATAVAMTYVLGSVSRTFNVCINGRIVQGGRC